VGKNKELIAGKIFYFEAKWQDKKMINETDKFFSNLLYEFAKQLVFLSVNSWLILKNCESVVYVYV
jgi:hypothetical protein